VKTLVDLQQDVSVPPAVRRGAARDLLAMGLRFGESVALEQRVAAIEERLRDHAGETGLHRKGLATARGAVARTRRQAAKETVRNALAYGATVATAASKAGLSERTVYRWLDDPAFRQQVTQTRADLVQRTAGMLMGTGPGAVKTLVDLQQDVSVPPAVRRGSARDVLAMGLGFGERVALEQRVAGLEERLEDSSAESGSAANAHRSTGSSAPCHDGRHLRGEPPAALSSRLARMERALAIASAFDTERQTKVRRQALLQLREVLDPYPEARDALAALLREHQEKADEAVPANQDQVRREFRKEYDRLMDHYPEAKAAVDAFLKNHVENDPPDPGGSGCHGGQGLQPG